MLTVAESIWLLPSRSLTLTVLLTTDALAPVSAPAISVKVLAESVPLSVGTSLVAPTLTVSVTKLVLLAPLMSVALKVIVRAAVSGVSEVLLNLTLCRAALYSAFVGVCPPMVLRVSTPVALL